MKSSPNPTSFYATGGTLPRDAPSYVSRQADQDLYRGLRQGHFCYVLTARQMGKSSLMVRTAARLREEGAAVVVLDLTAIGQNLTAEQWYDGLVGRTGQQLGLEQELEDFWLAHERLAPLHRWMRALREVVLTQQTGPVVIFIDEIDTVLSLPFSTDEFFAGIREFYNRRSEDRELHRLTFCLLGVATPSDLIRDTRTTPFNIGERIELNDFSEAEAAPLAKGLRREGKLGAVLLKRILYWTGGHPYLSQRLCQAVAEDASVSNAEGVDRLCEELFLSHRAQERDDNLLFVRERLLRSEADLASLLGLYQQVRKGKHVQDDDTNPLVSILRLSGVTRVADGCLQVRNRVYARVFDPEWVLANMPDADLRRQRAAYRRGVLRAAAVSVVILAFVMTLALVALRQARRAAQQEASNRRLLYAAQMNLAYRAWEGANVRRVLELLESQRPRPSQEDLRGFEWYYLWELCHSEMATWPYTDPDSRLRFSRDGKRLMASVDQNVTAWDVASRQKLYTIKGDETSKIALFSPDNGTLALVDKDNSVRLWDLANGRELASFKGHTGRITRLIFSPDSKTLATASEDNTVRLWDIVTRQESATLKAGTLLATPVSFSPDGRILILQMIDNTVKLWNVTTRQDLNLSKRPTEQVTFAAFTDDGKILATVVSEDSHSMVSWLGPRNGTSVHWFSVGLEFVNELNRGEVSEVLREQFRRRGKDLTPPIRVKVEQAGRYWRIFDANSSCYVRNEGRTLSVNTWDMQHTARMWSVGKRLRLWDVATRRELVTLKRLTEGISRVVFSPDSKTMAILSESSASQARFDPTSIILTLNATLWDIATRRELATLRGIADMSFSSDGKTLVTLSRDRTTQVWDVALGEELAFKGRPEQVRFVSFSPDGRILATGENKAVRLWDVTTRQELIALKGHLETISSVAFSPDGKTLATASSDHTIKLWDLTKTRELTASKDHRDSVTSVAFSPDGKLLATTGQDGAVKLWDITTRQELATLKGHLKGITAVAFSPDGKVLATVNEDHTAKLWDVTTRQEQATLKGHASWVISVAFSPDGRILATTSQDHTTKLWDVATRQELATLKGHTNGVMSVAFAPSGRVLATAGWDGTVKLWDVTTRQELTTLKGHASWVTCVAFAPDGKTLATAGWDGTVRLWDVATRQELITLKEHMGGVTCVVFSLDGKTLATGSDDTTVKLWHTVTRQELATLKGHARKITAVAFSPDGKTLTTASEDGVVKLWQAALDKDVSAQRKMRDEQ